MPTDMGWLFEKIPAVSILLIVMLSACTGANPGTGISDNTLAVSDCAGNETKPDFELSKDLPTRNDGFQLSADNESIERGTSITFTLTNVGNESRLYSSERYVVQRRISNGELFAGDWKTVTVFRAEEPGFNMSANRLDAGSSVEWTFHANATGFTADKYVVCEDIRPGQYRFVYAREPKLAVQFTILNGTETGASLTS